jgi:predicted ArsR family transcriptional regulator
MATRGPEPKVTESKLREHIESQENPFVTASEMAESLGVARQTAYKHLQRMHEDGKLRKEKIGGSAVIWWLPEESG